MTVKVKVAENNTPDERLGRIAGRLMDALDADPERGEERAVLLLSEPTDGGGGRMAVTAGYGPEDMVEAAGDVGEHLVALFAARGIDVRFEGRENVRRLVHGPAPESSPTGSVVTVTITDRKENGEQAITAVVESKPTLPLCNGEPDWDRLTPAQLTGLWALAEVGSKSETFEWRTVFRDDV